MVHFSNRWQALKIWGQTIALSWIFVFLICCATTDAALAAIAPSQQSLDTLQVHLGNQAGELVFEPDTLTFEAGKRYKLLLDNPSPVKHYFTAKDFTDVVWTQKVEAGQVEVKGAIHELELKPNAEAEWVLIPQKPGTYELHCSIAGHAEAGMVGQLTVTADSEV